MKVCIYDKKKICDNCYDCRCDLDPDKVCDNCMKCVDNATSDYAGIVIDDIIGGDGKSIKKGKNK